MLPWTSEERRSHERVRYMRANLSMRLRHPNGVEGGTYLVSRNISAGGMCVCHRGFLYPGSVCMVELASRADETIRLVADLKDCRYIEGRLHESNIAFREKVELSDVLSLSELSALAPEREPESAAGLAGLRVMMTCCDEGVGGLVKAALDEAGCVLHDVGSLGDAIEELSRSSYDAVVCGDLVSGAERATMLLKLRTSGRFSGRVVLAGFRESVGAGLIACDPGKKCEMCDPFDAASVVGAMPVKRRAA